jgi:hypothetical protein
VLEELVDQRHGTIVARLLTRNLVAHASTMDRLDGLPFG